MGFLLVTIVLAAATALTWWGSTLLETSAQGLAEHYKLPPTVEGGLLVAVGSSFPELSTVVVATIVHGQFDLGLASVVGSAIFNVLVIPGLSGILAGGVGFQLRVVYRDALFYLASMAVLLLAFSFAIIYEPLEGAYLEGTMTRWIAAIPLGLYGLYLFLQQQEAIEARKRSRPEPDSEHSKSALWFRLLAGLVLILAGVEGLLRSALWLGEALDTPNFLWGVTVVAAATSIPDTFVSARAARAGRGDVSLGNVLGSNIFDLLVAVPAGVLIAGSTVIRYGVAAPLMAALMLATIVLFATMRTHLRLGRRESWVLLAVYSGFVVWMALEVIGTTSFIL